MANSVSEMYWSAYWSQFLMFSITLFAIPEIAISVLLCVRTGFDVHALLVPAVLGFLTCLLHSVVATKWKGKEEQRAAVSSPQVIYSISFALLNAFCGFAWFGTSISILLTASKLSPDRNMDHEQGNMLYAQPPVLVWVPGAIASVLSVLHWTFSCLGSFSRQRFFNLGPSGPPRGLSASTMTPTTNSNDPANRQRVFSETHTKWIVGVISLSALLSSISFGVSFGDGALGGYSFWIITTAALLTLLFHLFTVTRWARTARERRGKAIPSSIYSSTLLVLLCLFACLWSAGAIVAFLVQFHKIPNKRRVRWPSNSRRYDVFLYARWIAAGLSASVAILTWIEFTLLFVYRSRFFKRAHLASTGAQPLQSAADYGMTPMSSNYPVAASGASAGAGNGNAALPEVQYRPSMLSTANTASFASSQYPYPTGQHQQQRQPPRRQQMPMMTQTTYPYARNSGVSSVSSTYNPAGYQTFSINSNNSGYYQPTSQPPSR